MSSLESFLPIYLDNKRAHTCYTLSLTGLPADFKDGNLNTKISRPIRLIATVCPMTRRAPLSLGILCLLPKALLSRDTVRRSHRPIPLVHHLHPHSQLILRPLFHRRHRPHILEVTLLRRRLYTASSLRLHPRPRHSTHRSLLTDSHNTLLRIPHLTTTRMASPLLRPGLTLRNPTLNQDRRFQDRRRLYHLLILVATVRHRHRSITRRVRTRHILLLPDGHRRHSPLLIYRHLLHPARARVSIVTRDRIKVRSIRMRKEIDMTGTTEMNETIKSTGLTAMTGTTGMIGRTGLTNGVEMTVTKRASGSTEMITLSGMTGNKGLRGPIDLQGSTRPRGTT